VWRESVRLWWGEVQQRSHRIREPMKSGALKGASLKVVCSSNVNHTSL
jgi:hypothetical protein